MKIALVHEWLGETGGSEKVFEALASIFAEADLYVLWDETARASKRPYRESWLSRTPLKKAKAVALPFMPLAWRTSLKGEYDLVLSSSHAFAHTVRGRGEKTRYFSYVHTPARYIWNPELDSRGSNPLASTSRHLLQYADRKFSQHVVGYAANSHEVRQRIERCWGREATVINPPVDLKLFHCDAPRARGGYLLGVGRWIPYKRFDMMIDIAERAKRPLIIAGGGPEENRLRDKAAGMRVDVQFFKDPSNQDLKELYSRAHALLYPAHEDFGIVPLEARASGTPVVGLAAGGLLETVQHEVSGLLVDDLSADAFAEAVGRAGALESEGIAAGLEKFSHAEFERNIRDWLRIDGDAW